ncbi:dicarboxylate/amino acid:cation symporter [Saccharibacillus alkalitolerans]|uniref:Dicarboxylate/amino acid:cation symporter n=1 Tax=Saccharibacillus alkalitolerans TaxID=2705290 RepID=A0ABX0F489_9BACL|nr:dicarboxylate/amino acid:cation symporter [Saccharibacillus alkalitolerans]NGZ74814.1 dicarboxylate/amino acid:cation symporter [Saccharibacillus alkalitolerans]
MRLNLLTQILIAFVLSIVLGLIFGPAIAVIQPLGDLFLRLIKFVVVPLVLSSLVIGVAGTGSLKQLGALGGKTIAYYMVTTAVAVGIGIVAGLIFMPGAGLSMPGTGEKPEVAQAPGVTDMLLGIVPTNPVESLVSGNMLQIIFFAVFVGLGITMLGEKSRTVYKFFEEFAEIMYKITGIVMRFAPFGILGLTAPIVGQYGLSVLLPLMKLLLAFAAGCLVHFVVTYLLAVRALGRMSPLVFVRGIAPAMLVAFSTSSSSGTLPVTIKSCEDNLKVPRRVTSFVLPLGATINMDGTAMYQGLAALFIAQVFGIDLSFTQLLMIVLTATLGSIGAAGVPGAALVMLSMVTASVGLPLEGVALIAGVDRILDMFRTTLNVSGDASAAVVVSAKERRRVQSPKEASVL